MNYDFFAHFFSHISSFYLINYKFALERRRRANFRPAGLARCCRERGELRWCWYDSLTRLSSLYARRKWKLSSRWIYRKTFPLSMFQASYIWNPISKESPSWLVLVGWKIDIIFQFQAFLNSLLVSSWYSSCNPELPDFLEFSLQLISLLICAQESLSNETCWFVERVVMFL